MFSYRAGDGGIPGVVVAGRGFSDIQEGTLNGSQQLVVAPARGSRRVFMGMSLYPNSRRGMWRRDPLRFKTTKPEMGMSTSRIGTYRSNARG